MVLIALPILTDGRVNYKAALTLPHRERNMKPVVEHGQGKLLTAEEATLTTPKYPRKKFHIGVIIDVKTSAVHCRSGETNQEYRKQEVGKCSPCLAKLPPTGPSEPSLK